MDKDTALRLALEALTNAYWPTDSDLLPAHNMKECGEAITAIKAALEAKDEPVAIHCKAKRENNGVCPNHNLQCGWPKCNEPLTPVRVISSEQLSAMFQDLKGIDTSQSGYHWRVGYNAALRQAMDYSMPSYTTPPQRTWVGLTEDEIVLISADCAASHQHTDIHFARAIEAKLKDSNG
jgi:hypothetical protein